MSVNTVSLNAAFDKPENNFHHISPFELSHCSAFKHQIASMMAYRDALHLSGYPIDFDDPTDDVIYDWPNVRLSSDIADSDQQYIRFGLAYEESGASTTYILKEIREYCGDSCANSWADPRTIGRYTDLTTAIRLAHEHYLRHYYDAERERLEVERETVEQQMTAALAEIARKQAFLLSDGELPFWGSTAEVAIFPTAPLKLS